MTGDAPLNWMVGDVRVTRVEESVIPLPPSILVPGITPDQIAGQRPWIDPFFDDEGNILLSIHSLVVESRGTTILVDACVGVGTKRPLPGNPTFPDRLGDAIEGGLDSVDFVLCTHLHFDHVGWTTRLVDGTWVPTFPNARYLMGRREVEYLDEHDDSNEVREPVVDPLGAADVLDLISPDHEITDEVHTIPTPGHTPGHVSVLIESSGETALISGDAFHTPLQLAHPELAATHVDWDSDMSSNTRRQLIADHENSDTLLIGTHFAPPTAGHIRSDGSGTRLAY